MPVQIWVLTPSYISIDNSGNISVLAKVIQVITPSCLFSINSLFISFTFISGKTANITMFPSVACGKLNSNGVANNNVKPTTIMVITEDNPLKAPLDSLTADLENEPETGILPLMPDVILAKPWPSNS